VKLSVIIVNYNVKYFLEQCLLSVIKAASHIETEILVVDNNSSDGSVDYIRQRFPSVNVIANKDNPGFSKANNQGIRMTKGEFILILNPDTLVAEDTFDICIDFMNKHADAGTLGVKMIDGKGNFLPESKRALPTPEVAFYKMFGLARLFPHSHRFGKYHLSYLSKDETNPVDILSGAFMFFRKKVLDEVGYFDEAFFMYGEDIDLSYRVLKAGYKNYYLADTTIIHYKGESTKKGSLNYVKVFYQAMIIFARKHFAASRAGFFSFLIHLAVVFRALVTVVLNLLSSSYLILIDALISFWGIFYLVHLYASSVKNAPEYYPLQFIGMIIPGYILIWIISAYFSGGYEKPYRVAPVFRGIAVGTIVIAALYGFLPEAWRFSRAIILLGGFCTGTVMLLTRLLYSLLRYQQFTFERVDNNRVIVAGSPSSIQQTRAILQSVAPLSELVSEIDLREHTGDIKSTAIIFKAKEIILCSDVLSYKEIIEQILQLGNGYNYKIFNPSISVVTGRDLSLPAIWADRGMSLPAIGSLIGSNSKNNAGDLYAADINLNLAKPIARHQKRLLDVLLCLVLLPLSPVLIFIVKHFGSFIANWAQVLSGTKTWIGYWEIAPDAIKGLPPLRGAVIHQAADYSASQISSADVRKLNYLYAKHYSISDDLGVLVRNIRSLGT
jgi:GT2 family glycosyltransferase